MHRLVLALVLWLPIAFGSAALAAGEPEVTLAQSGKPTLHIYAIGSADLRPAAADLQQFLGRIVGGSFELKLVDRFSADAGPGIYLGVAADFPWVKLPKDLASQEYILRTDQQSRVLLIGGDITGAANAVYALLDRLGCRWFFPGHVWEVIPTIHDLHVSLDERAKPDFDIQRRLVYGWGMHSPTISADFKAWTRRNRLDTPLEMQTSHSWPYETKAVGADHADWFALVKGRRPEKPDAENGKPCYSNPQVVAAGIDRALKYFAQHPAAQMITVSAPDGAGFCECPECLKQARVAEPYRGPGGYLFGTNPEGQTVSVASETIFHYANAVARAVAAKYPGKFVGILAYSGYSHPPSFDLEPNVYVELTAGYRNTPLTYAEQIAAFAKHTKHLGVYEYYDVAQWSWELPGKARAANLDYLASSIGYFHDTGVTSLKAEASNNWAPNGLGYYLAARLLWKADTDARVCEEEFYRLAFGPAAEPVRRFYRLWQAGADVDDTTLALAFRDLQEAAELTGSSPECRARVDDLRLYAHFLAHYVKPPATDAAAPGTNKALQAKYGSEVALQRVQDLGELTRRLMDTHLVHSYPFNSYLGKLGAVMPELHHADWRKPGTIPTAAEVEQWFAADRKGMDLSAAKELVTPLYSHDLVPLADDDGQARTIDAGSFRRATLLVWGTRGHAVEMSLATPRGEIAYSVWFVPRPAFVARREGFVATQLAAGKTAQGELRFVPDADGFYEIRWENGAPRRINRPAVLAGGAESFIFDHANLYFCVPKETRRFLIQVAGRHPNFIVRNAKGESLLQVAVPRGKATDDGSPIQKIIEVPPSADATIWSVSGPHDPISYGAVRLIGVPNYLSFHPEQLLVPKEVR